MVMNVDKFIKEHGGYQVWNLNQIKRRLICLVCQQSVEKRMLLLDRHINTSKHRTNTAVFANQAIRPVDTSIKTSFLKDLYRLFIRLNIPLFKIEHSFFKYFLQKYTGRRVPSRRKLGLCIREESKGILSQVKGVTQHKNIFLMVDVREDAKNRVKGIVLIGPLDGRSLERPFLIDVKLKKPDALDESLRQSLLFMYGSDFDFKRLKLLISTSSYLKAAERLKEHCPEMIHVSCVATALHEALRDTLDEFVDVKSLIAKTREMLNRSDDKIRSDFALVCPEPLPGEFMDAVSWHYRNFEAIRNFIMSADNETMGETLFLSDSVYFDLMVIHTNLRGVKEVVMSLGNRLTLLDGLNLIEREFNQIVLEPHKSKFRELLKTTPGFTELESIGSQLTREPQGPLFEYANAPIALSDFDKVFALLREVYTYERVAMTEKSLRDIMIASWNVNVEKTIIP